MSNAKNNGANNNNNFGGKMIMTNGTIKTMEAFAGTVKSAMQALYTDGYRVEIQKVSKNNGLTLTGLTIRKEGINIAPTIYLDGFYKEYRNGQTMESIVKALRDIYENNKVKESFSVDAIADFDSVQGRICFKLVNVERNREFLSHAPYIPYQDLAIVFYILLSNGEEGNATIQVHNGFMDMWGNPDVEDLFILAKKNTQRFFKGRVASMLDVMREIVSEHSDNVDSELADAFFEMDVYDDDFMPMFVATNTNKFNGAGVILYDGLLAKFAEKMGTDFFIIPSSIHETIFVPAINGMDADCLLNMVREVNATEVSPDEVLSDRVYLYHADEDYVEMM